MSEKMAGIHGDDGRLARRRDFVAGYMAAKTKQAGGDWEPLLEAASRLVGIWKEINDVYADLNANYPRGGVDTKDIEYKILDANHLVDEAREMLIDLHDSVRWAGRK